MANYRTSRIIPTLLIVIVIIIAIVGLISLARAIFTSGSSADPLADTTEQSLVDTTDSRSVSMSVRGPIVADENFKSYKIVVSPTSRTITTYNGYLDTVVQQQSLANNTAAYEEFVNALNIAGMTSGNQPKEGEGDVRGACATGELTEFSLLNNSQSVETLWSSTCKDARGTLRANADQLVALFAAQIPEFNSFTNDLFL